MGIRSPYLFQEDGGSGFLKQFYGGMMTTCGITYSGAAGVDNGKALGLHGPMSNIPAEQVSASIEYEGDERVIRVRGQVHEAEVFGTDMLMKRCYTLETERDIVHIHDVVTNQSFEKQPVMLIYHINFGYPMLDAGAKAYFSAGRVTPRTDFAAEGEAFAMLHNEKLGLAAIIRFDQKVFPLMCQWKCMRAGEYALGLEPTTSGVVNRSEARELGNLTYLEAGESREYNVSIELTEDAAVIEHYKSIAHKE